MSESWATIPSFPEYQINAEGEVRYTENKERLPMLKVYGANCYILVREGKTWTKTQKGLLKETKPHIHRKPEVPLKEAQ